MPPNSISDRASSGGAFLVSRWVIGGFLLGAVPWAAPLAGVCATTHVDEWVQVRHVIDGDTVVLVDGRKLRLIGVDTPELGYGGNPHEAFAVQARDVLTVMLSKHQNTLGLRFDPQRRDHYGRVLAHGYLGDGVNVSATLLAKGLAVQLTIPPNIGNVYCYHNQEAGAEQGRRGIWALSRYQPQENNDGHWAPPGFRVVRGRVSSIDEGRNTLWIQLEGGIRLGISRQDLNYFTGLEPKSLVGRRVEARGRLRGPSGRERIRIRHPVALRILPENGNNSTNVQDYD